MEMMQKQSEKLREWMVMDTQQNNEQWLDTVLEHFLAQVYEASCDENRIVRAVVKQEHFNQLRQSIIAELQRREVEAQLRGEIKVHDYYWHMQKYVEQNGIGQLALENKEKVKAQLQSSTKFQQKGESK